MSVPARRLSDGCGGMDVLVIDDEPIIVRRLTALLAGLGYIVTPCTDSEWALDIIERRHFPLIITDLKMRKVDGMDILNKVRGMNKDIKVIVMTGFGDGESLAAIIDQGAAQCLRKPFKMNELRQAIATISVSVHDPRVEI